MNCGRFCVSFFLFLLFAAACIPTTGRGQSYGLGFISHEAVPDKRTSLDLFLNKSITIDNNFKLSFDLSFFPGQKDYYGYIFRIIENGKRNIDLIYIKRGLISGLNNDQNSFKLVVGEKFTHVNFDIRQDMLMDHWNKVSLEFDFDHDELILYVNNIKYIEPHAHLHKKSEYNFAFGASNYPNFKIHDVPPMKIKNVQLDIGDKTHYSWPLNESAGKIARDVISSSNASVINPLWMRALHNEWDLAGTFYVKGIASTAFNAAGDMLYIIGRDSLLNYSVKTSASFATNYNSGYLNLPLGNQSAFNPFNKRLYNFYFDKHNSTVTSFDFTANKWLQNYTYKPTYDYLQCNSFFSSVDSSLYILGGYGHYTYKNDIHRYDFPSNKWETAILKSGSFYPRYLAGLGTIDNGRIAYLLGGYGSHNGQQVLNPQNFYDLYKLDVKARTCKKLFDLKVPAEDFACANSLVIDAKAQTYYALVFPSSAYNSHLQLLIGSLRKPDYQLTGSLIPYTFYDGHSTANLYYSPGSHKLIAVTTFRVDNTNSFSSSENNSIVKVYTLATPPDLQPPVVYASSPSSSIFTITTATILCLIIASGSIIWIKRRNNRQIAVTGNGHDISIDHPLINYAADNYIATDLKLNSILLFGDMKLYTAKGVDITKQFTPLIKELFLVIFLNSLKSGRGVSPEKLLELLWADKSETSARNNRAANLSRLKSYLNQMDHVHLSVNTGNWKIEIDFSNVYADYHLYLQIVTDRKSLDKQKITALMDITKRGNFLTNAEYPWLDHIKSEVSNEIIDIYLNYVHNCGLTEDPEFLIKLGNCIFNFDPVNEEAMVIKCKALAQLGKHSLAKSTFVTFNKEYMELYGESFNKDFQTVLKQS